MARREAFAWSEPQLRTSRSVSYQTLVFRDNRVSDMVSLDEAERVLLSVLYGLH